jgi:xylulokinase
MTGAALGIDVGTGSTKAALVDRSGTVVAIGRAPHPITTPRFGWSETAPAAWLTSTRVAVSQVLSAAGRPEVSVIGLSGQMHGVVLCARDGTPIRDAVLWSDQRAQADISRLRSELEPLAPILGNPVVAGTAGPTIASLRRSEPDSLRRTTWALQPKDWLRFQLTGEVATDPSDASATLLWDLPADRWSDEACAAFGVERAWLPPVRPSGAEAGRLTADGAALLGLGSGIAVASGAADTAAALFGSGVAVGEAQVSTGTGAQIARVLDRPALDPHRCTHLYRAAQPGRWYAMAAMQNAGIAVDWALRILGIDLEQAEAGFEATPAGSHGVVFVPYLTGERTPHLDAALTAQWSGLSSRTTRDDLIRAVFEGVACSIRDGLDALRDAGHDIDRALLAGGGSTAVWWRQLLADVLAIPLVPHDSVDASARGAALLGLRCIGHGVDPSAAVTRSAPIEPRTDHTALLRRYRDLVGAIVG